MVDLQKSASSMPREENLRESLMKSASLTAFAIAATAALTACTTVPTDPKLQSAGAPPQNVNAIVRSYLNESLKDPYSLKELAISPAREGGLWTGTINQGMVPSWYSCVEYNAKNSYGAYTGKKRYIIFMRDNKVVASVDKQQDGGWHKHAC